MHATDLNGYGYTEAPLIVERAGRPNFRVPRRPLTGNGGCTAGPNPDYMYVGLASSDSSNNNFVYLAGQAINVYQTGSWVVSLPYTQLIGTAPSASFRLHARVALEAVTSGCQVAVDFDDFDGPPEYSSPTTDFWGGDVYTYAAPTWRSGEFYPAPAIAAHNQLVGTLSWQNGSLDPVLYYDMTTAESGRNDLLRDMSGHGNDAQLFGTTSVPGVAGNARSFDGGTTDYAQAPDASGLHTIVVSVSFWAKWITLPPGDGTCGAGSSSSPVITDGSYTGPWWFELRTDGTLDFYVTTSTGSYAAGIFPAQATGSWHHYVGTYDGSYIRIYKDGSPVGNPASLPGVLKTPSNGISIAKGFGTGCGSKYTNAVVDEVNVFNRVLPPAEVTSLATQLLWYDMETSAPSGALADMSGYQNVATATATTPAPGTVGKALAFNGASSYLYAAPPSTVSGAFTVDAWVKPASAASGTVYNFFSTRTPGYQYGFDAKLQNGNTIHGDIGTGSAWITSAADASFTYAANAWYHVMYVVTTTGYTIYVNGSRVGSGTYSSSTPLLWNANQHVYIGQVGYVGGEWFNGAIDDVHVFSRALSAGDLVALNGPKSTPPSRTFFAYNSAGKSTEQKTYHNGTWLYTSRTFDSYGNLLSSTDPSGHVTSYQYSSSYQYAYVTTVSQGSSTQTYAYDFATGLSTSVTNPRGYTTLYTYDLLGRVTSSTGPAVTGGTPVTTYVYDDSHDIVTVYDPNSMPRLFHYDMETLFNGTMEDLSGHGNMGTMYGTTSAGGKVGLGRWFNGAGDYIQSSGVLQASSSLTIAAWVYHGSIQTDPLGDVFNGNTVGQLKVSNGNGGVVYAQYYDGTSWRILTSKSKVPTASWTHVVATFAPSGTSTVVKIYMNGALDSNSPATLPGHPTGSYAPTVGAYSSTTERYLGTLDEVQVFNVTLTSPQVTSLYQGTMGGRYAKTYYDGLGREVRSVQRSFFSGPSTSGYLQTSYTNNWQDRVVSYTNPYGSTYQTEYDFLARTTFVINPDNSYRSTAYVDAGQYEVMWDEINRVTENFYDVGGRLTSVQQYSGSTWYTTSYAYDLAGELVAVTDPLGQTTRHAYDDAGRLSQTTYPDGTSESYVYDNVGNLIAKTDRAGRTMRYAYDLLNRLTMATYPGGNTLRYIYDANGNVLSVQNGTATLWFAYDALDRMTSRSLNISGDANYTMSYGYDLTGNLLTLTYPDSQGTLTYTYDAFYRVTSMSFGGTTIASFTYRADGLLSSASYGDGSLATLTYDARGFPMENKVTAGSTTLMDLTYLENAAGDILTMNDAASTDYETFQYDQMDRLTVANGPGWQYGYGYDAAGNRLTLSNYGTTTTWYAYGPYNQLCASSTSSVSCATPPSSTVTKYTYDANGNLASKTSSTTTTYAFDLDNRLVKAVTPATTYAFAYDGLGDRIREIATGTGAYTNTYVASGDQMLYLKNIVGSTTTKTVYLYAGSLLIASVTGSTRSYFHEDHLGSTRLVTQKPHGSVVVVFSTFYQPFGAPYAASGSDPGVKYTGQWSEAVGLYWNHARYYDPALGRFVSQDPVLGSLSKPETQDRYAYVANNPLKYVDPNGRFLEIIVGAIIGAVVGYVGCGVATGGWTSGQCGEAALAGAAVGALAGLTFGASLALAGTAGLGTAAAGGGFTFAGVSGLAAFTFAGATSGAIAGAAGYFASGGIALANGQSWSFSSRNFINSVGWGIAFGAATGAAGYGIGKGFGRLAEWWSTTEDSNPATFWDQGSFDSPEDSLAYHWARHAEPYGISEEQYTQDALNFRNANWGNPEVEQGPVQISGGRIGWKFWGQPGGIFTQGGKIVSFWYD